MRLRQSHSSFAPSQNPARRVYGCFEVFLKMFFKLCKGCLKVFYTQQVLPDSCQVMWFTKPELKNLKGAVLDMYIVKDGASFCYCAYVLRISGYSGFLRNLPPNTAIFLCGL